MTLYIRMVILMKIIICDEWTLHNKLRASMLIPVGANNLVARSYLMSRYYVSSFYSRLNHKSLF